MWQRLKRLWTQPEPAAEEAVEIMPDNIPVHIAIIMDGNGRWAKRRGLPRVAGHHAGMKAIKRVTMAANDLGVKVLTLYSFSTENWKRPQDEVEFLMKLPQEFLLLEIEELVQKNVQVRMMGWRDNVPPHTLAAVEEAIERTKENTGLILNFAFNYGSRLEILSAIRQLAEAVQQGHLTPEEITEEDVSACLLSADLPDPDMIIRTSGEIRISNFMLWQMAYAELWFTDIYWPDFDEPLFRKAVGEYQRRARRYGGL
ncbi:isoprenyl transferase [Paenibacillus koleovorans]|uniref:isoprenyl transferase n=1 Tax=Paenibacillus koleovorans TaxID=121608 RepID=UPI000FDC6FD6|nr:isoprenyl transferase [Paenibacillus koleovorans]